jgi:hypothetical protein
MNEHEHVPSDSHCVRYVGGEKTGTCWICAKYDNAVWLTQREVFEASHY